MMTIELNPFGLALQFDTYLHWQHMLLIMLKTTVCQSVEPRLCGFKIAQCKWQKLVVS